MPLAAARYSFTAATSAPPPAPETPFLDTATAWWSPSYYDSVADVLVDQIGARHLLAGATVGADSADPTLADDGIHVFADFNGNDYYRHAADGAFDFSGTANWAVVAVALLNTTSGNRYLVSNRGAANVTGWAVGQNGGNAFGYTHSGGQFNAGAGTAATGSVNTWALTSNGTVFSLVKDGVVLVTDAYVAITSNAGPLNVGRYEGASSFLEGHVFGVAVWKGSTLTAAETDTVGDELLSVAEL